MRLSATLTITTQSSIDKMRRSNKARTDRNENYFSRRTFFKKSVGENNEANSWNEKKQRSDFAILFEIGGQKTEQGDDNRDADDYIFDSFVRQKRDTEKGQKGDYKRHRQAMYGTKPGNSYACFIPETVRVECLKV